MSMVMYLRRASHADSATPSSENGAEPSSIHSASRTCTVPS